MKRNRDERKGNDEKPKGFDKKEISMKEETSSEKITEPGYKDVFGNESKNVKMQREGTKNENMRNEKSSENASTAVDSEETIDERAKRLENEDRERPTIF